MSWEELKAADSTYLDASKRFCVALQITAQASSETWHGLSLYAVSRSHCHVVQAVCLASSLHRRPQQGLPSRTCIMWLHCQLIVRSCLARCTRACCIRHHPRVLAFLLLLLLLLVSLSQPRQPRPSLQALTHTATLCS